MRWTRIFRRFRRTRPWDEDIAREIEAYLDIETQENIAHGMAPDEARYAARRALGNPLLIKEEVGRMHRWHPARLIDTGWQDVRHAGRLFRRDPGFSLLAVLTLALGIGAVTVIYSVIHNVLFDPFPYIHSDRMVDVLVRDAERPDAIFRGPLTVPEFLDFQAQSQSFDKVAGAIGDSMMLATAEGTERLEVVRVTANSFDFLGVQPLIGRGIDADAGDGRPGSPPIVVLSHKFWVSRFSADPGVIGRVLRLDGEPRTIVGVMPPRFTWHIADAWVPAVLDRSDPEAATRPYWFQAHLKPGVTIEAAAAELTLIAARRARIHPTEYPKKVSIQVITVIDWVVGRYRGVLYTLLAAVGLLLLIACCNVANMLLARATAREREMTVRAALGAGRLRIVRQLLVESMLLALCGAAAGCALAYGGLQVLAYAMPQQNVPYEVELRIDGPVLLVTLTVSILAAVLFGLAPALHGARRELVAGLKESGKGSAGGGARHRRLRNGLVIAEIALSLVLLLGAGLLMRSFVALLRVDLGFDPANVLIVPVTFADGQRPSAAAKEAFFTQALPRLAALPGVVSVAQASAVPPFIRSTVPIDIPGTVHTERWTAGLQLCTEQLFTLFERRFVRGRPWSALDARSARRVAVVNEAFVARYLGGRDPLRATVEIPALASRPAATPATAPAIEPRTAAGGAEPAVFEIVGVMTDVRNRSLQDAPAPEVYVPSAHNAASLRGLMIRTAIPPLSLVEAVRREVWAVDRSVAMSQSLTMDGLMRQSYAQPRFTLLILSVFAGVGLVLVAIGVYGVMAYTIAQQTQEIAIRIALGASRWRVVRTVLRLGLWLIGSGLVAGLVASLGTNRLIANQLWQTSPRDPLTIAVAAVVIVVIGLVACGVPAWRALRIDPMRALRHE